jgi:hypothetical protein
MRFSALWAIGAASLKLSARLHRCYNLPPSGGDFARHLTLVARLPQISNTRIAEVVAALQRGNPSHYYYPTETIHLTIRNLDDAQRDSIDHGEFLVRLRNCIGSCGPLLMRGRGLGVSPNSVFLQLFPEDHSLAELRRKLSSFAQDTRKIGGAVSPSDMFLNQFFRKLAFANLIRFSGGISPSFISEIRHCRNTCFGHFAIKELELVQTDKLLSHAGTEIIDRVILT